MAGPSIFIELCMIGLDVSFLPLTLQFAICSVADGVFTPHWYNLVEYINDEMTLAMAVVKAMAASALYSPFANGLFLAGAWVLSYGMKVQTRLVERVN